MMKIFVLLQMAVLPFFAGAATAQNTPPRTALVMGVGDYGGATFKGGALPNLPGITTADLPQMAAKLKSLGFTVTVVSNPTLKEARAAVDTFSAAIKASPGVSLFYFSGHGGEFEGKNYLIPRKASIGSKADLGEEALSAQRVLNGMEESGAQVNLVFLDCCREDLGKGVGGAEMQPMRAKGSFIGFATRSGDVADPGAEGSPYTRFLLKRMDTPGLSVTDMYSTVIGDVKKYTKDVLGEERRPGFYSELDAPFFFVPAGAAVAVPSIVEKASVGGWRVQSVDGLTIDLPDECVENLLAQPVSSTPSRRGLWRTAGGGEIKISLAQFPGIADAAVFYDDQVDTAKCVYEAMYNGIKPGVFDVSGRRAFIQKFAPPKEGENANKWFIGVVILSGSKIHWIEYSGTKVSDAERVRKSLKFE